MSTLDLVFPLVVSPARFSHSSTKTTGTFYKFVADQMTFVCSDETMIITCNLMLDQLHICSYLYQWTIVTTQMTYARCCSWPDAERCFVSEIPSVEPEQSPARPSAILLPGFGLRCEPGGFLRHVYLRSPWEEEQLGSR